MNSKSFHINRHTSKKKSLYLPFRLLVFSTDSMMHNIGWLSERRLRYHSTALFLLKMDPGGRRKEFFWYKIYSCLKCFFQEISICPKTLSMIWPVVNIFWTKLLQWLEKNNNFTLITKITKYKFWNQLN